MKLHLLKFFTVLVLLLGGKSIAQPLNNTGWIATAGTTTIQLYFGNDTMYFVDQGMYFPYSLYTASSGSFTIIDIDTSICTNTGSYTYSINNNILTFVIVNDACTDRSSVLAGLTWTSTTVGITANAKKEFQLYPNPVTDGFARINCQQCINEKLDIYSMDGKLLDSFDINDKELISLKNYSPGIYLGRLSGKTVRIIVE